MEKILYAQLMLINILVLVVIWQSDAYRSRGPLMISQKAFRALIAVDIAAMICDMVQVMYDGTTFSYSNIIGNVTIFLYYVLHCMVAFVFTLYVDYEIYPDTERFKRRFRFYCIPVVINIGLSISSFWNGIYFVINENNSYERGSIFYVPLLISFGYVIYILFMLIEHKKKKMMVDDNMQKELYTRLFLFRLLFSEC